MARLLSVTLTEPQVLARTKTVTRRLGWWTDRHGRRLVEVGDELHLVRKSQGRRRSDGTVEPLVVLAAVRVVGVTRERLDEISPEDVVAEGFPEWSPDEFVEFFCSTHRGCTPSSVVTRIEWAYIHQPISMRGATAASTTLRLPAVYATDWAKRRHGSAHGRLGVVTARIDRVHGDPPREVTITTNRAGVADLAADVRKTTNGGDQTSRGLRLSARAALRRLINLGLAADRSDQEPDRG